MKIDKGSIIAAIIITILVFGFFLFLTRPIKKVIDNCEEKGWDGSEYDTGVVDIKIFEESETIKVKCNKATETDPMKEIINGLYFWEKKEWLV